MSKRRLMVLSALVAGMVGIRSLRKRMGSDAKKGEEPRTLWWMHHYAISPDMPEVLRQWELSTLLRRHGWAPTIIASAFNHKLRKYARPVRRLNPILEKTEEGIDFVWLYTSPYDSNNWRRYVNMVSYLGISFVANLFRPSPSVIIGTSPHLLAGVSAWLLAKRHRVPFILEVQDLWPESIVQLGVTSRIVVAPLEWIERFLYTHADHILSLSDGITEGIVAKGISRDKVTLISNAAMRPEPVDARERQDLRERMGWADKKIAIWVGAHGPANGLDVIVEAARILRGQPDIHFALIGDGPEKAALMGQGAGLPNLTFHDPIPKSQVESYLRAADMGIMNSRQFHAFEGTRPCKLFDYMAASLPIVSSMPGEAGRITQQAESGLQAQWEDPTSIADTILQLAEDEDLRRQLGQNGFEYSLTHSREDTADELAEVIDMVLSRGS